MVARLAELATNRQVGGEDDEDAAFRKRSVFSGLRNLLAAIALQQPLVVVIEGLQWADKASLELLADTMKTPDPLPILIVLVTRPDERVAALLESVVRIELRGLSTEEQVRLVEARLGVREGVRQVCADLMPKVAGNPFFLLEMVDALLERGALEIREVEGPDGSASRMGGATGEVVHALVRTERADSSAASLPQTLEQLVGDRLAELPAEEKELVAWLAVAGGPLTATELGTLAGPDHEEASIRLCARGLCDKRGEALYFRHPLTRDVAYGALVYDVARPRGVGRNSGAPFCDRRRGWARGRLLRRGRQRSSKGQPIPARRPLLRARPRAPRRRRSSMLRSP
jgi:predicted ATPase